MNTQAASMQPYQEIIAAGKRKDVLTRFLSKRDAVRYAFARQSELARSILPHVVTVADGNVSYVKNSKSGCTTISNLLYRCEHESDFSGNIHLTPNRLRAGYADWLEIRKSLDKGFSFSVVRDPSKRAVSAFIDIFINQKNSASSKHLERIREFGFFDKLDTSYRFDAFLEYVNSSLSLSQIRTDRHLRPQHINLGHGEFVLSYIGRLETLDADLRKVSEMVGINIPQSTSISDAKKNKSGSEAFAPSANQQRQIQTLYAKDYEIFGY